MAGNPSLAVVLDASGSMASADCAGYYPSRMLAAKAALGSFLDKLEDGLGVGLVIFDGEGVHPHVTEVRSKEAARAALQDIAPRSGTAGSPLGAAVAAALGELPAMGHRSIVVVSDGEASDPELLLRVLSEARAAGVRVTMLAFCNRIHGAAGLAHSYVEARRPEDLRAALAVVEAEVRAPATSSLGVRLLSWYRHHLAPSSRTARTRAADTAAPPRGEKEDARATRIGGEGGNGARTSRAARSARHGGRRA